MAAIGVSGVIFAIIKYFSRGPPRTMTKEWQEATNEYMKVRYLYVFYYDTPTSSCSPAPEGPGHVTADSGEEVLGLAIAMEFFRN